MKFNQVINGNKLFRIIHRTNFRVIHVGLDGCNYRCKECVTMVNPMSQKRVIKSDTAKMAKIITRFCLEYEGDETMLVWFGVGEPFYHKDAMFDIVRRIPDNIGCGVTTNGSLIPHTDELNQLFRNISISMYFVDEEVYQDYTGEPLQPVLDNLKWLVDNFMNNITITFIPFTWYYTNEKTHEWCKVVKSIVGDCPRVQIRGFAHAYFDEESNTFKRDWNALDSHMKIVRQYFRTWATYKETHRDKLTKNPHWGHHGNISLLNNQSLSIDQ